jgi:hypothetical protein
MNELDRIWPQMLDEAARSAVASGRHQLAEYIRLKATNDAIRTAAAGWLIDTFIELASEAMRDRFNLAVEREEPYSFKRGNSTLVGTLIEVRQGVRKLRLAVGWTRAPSHGIMQKGALAYARFTHLGMPKANAEIRLIHGTDLPQWLSNDDKPVGTEDIAKHLSVLLS